MTTQFVYYVRCQYPDSLHDTQLAPLPVRPVRFGTPPSKSNIASTASNAIPILCFPSQLATCWVIILCALRPCRGGGAVGAPRARDVEVMASLARTGGVSPGPYVVEHAIDRDRVYR